MVERKKLREVSPYCNKPACKRLPGLLYRESIPMPSDDLYTLQGEVVPFTVPIRTLGEGAKLESGFPGPRPVRRCTPFRRAVPASTWWLKPMCQQYTPFASKSC